MVTSESRALIRSEYLIEQARVLALCATLLAGMGLDASEPIAVAIEPSLNRRFDHLD